MSIKIIVDVMGGDNAPGETVRGVLAAAKEYDAQFIIVGDEAQIRAIAAEENAALSPFRIVHTEEVITMEDNPACVMRAKKESSMAVALRLLADGEGDALVSTGNTGALFTGAMLIVKKIRGLQRAGIAAMVPVNPPVLVLDSGANVEVTEENLEQFAQMGSVHMKKLYGMESPRVGLLNNGTEDCKGTPLQVSAYQRLAACPEINFVGNIEGSMISKNCCDVVVTDGFTGNITIKTIEGTSKFFFKEIKSMFKSGIGGAIAYLLLKKSINNMKKRLDPNEIGGAPILGVSKPVIKAHGSSNAKAFKNAIRQAIAYVSTDAIGEIADAMQAFADRKKAEKQAAATESVEQQQ